MTGAWVRRCFVVSLLAYPIETASLKNLGLWPIQILGTLAKIILNAFLAFLIKNVKVLLSGALKIPLF